MTVYVVTEGEFSDYQIMSVFSTAEKADAFVARWRGCRIEKYEMDGAGQDAEVA